MIFDLEWEWHSRFICEVITAFEAQALLELVAGRGKVVLTFMCLSMPAISPSDTIVIASVLALAFLL